MDTLTPGEPASPVLVIAYDSGVCDVLAKHLVPFGTRVAVFDTFLAAEALALAEPCSGVLVDLTSIVKAKSEEKIVAYTLTRLFPTLRVRVIGPMIIPMVMSGDAQQDKSLHDFVSKTCANTVPRRLRSHRRKDICVPTVIGDVRGFTLNFSWGGVFIADMNPERFAPGERLTVTLPDFGLQAEVVVRRVQLWGAHRPPGIGVEFVCPPPLLKESLYTLLRSDSQTDRDRLIT
jgi:hypothetical protein